MYATKKNDIHINVEYIPHKECIMLYKEYNIFYIITSNTDEKMNSCCINYLIKSQDITKITRLLLMLLNIVL